MKSITANTLIFIGIFCGIYYFTNTALSQNTNPQDYLEDYSKKYNSKKYNIENIIIVDMGSTGTRMHAYSIKKSTLLPVNALPQIDEIAISKSEDNQAVANYCNNPKAIHNHITPLYRQLATELKKLRIDISTTPIYFFATAGMRLYSKEKQNLVYHELENSVIELGHDAQITTKTIPGELEGIFDWLSVNYKLQTLQNKQATIAALDMGGASTQIAMEYNSTNNKKKNIYLIKFAEKEYQIYSKSILGYGLTQTKKRVNNFNVKDYQNQCNIHHEIIYDKYKHPLGFDINTSYKTTHIKTKEPVADFNFHTCSKLIKSYLKNRKEHRDIAKVVRQSIKNNMQFLAFSGYFYNFNFFNSKQPEDLIKSIPDSCHIRRKEFKQQFPKMTETALNEACFDATYLKILLNNAYDIPENYSNFTLPKHDIDWTIGASLFIATHQAISFN